MPVKNIVPATLPADGVDTTVARPVDFKAVHTAPPWVLTYPSRIASTGNVWTDMPPALTDLFGHLGDRTKIDLTHATDVRLSVRVVTAGVTAAKVRVQYSTDQSAWNYLDGSAGPSVTIDSVGTKASTKVALAAGAKADVFIRFVGLDGNGVADPVFGTIGLEVY